MLHEMDLQQYPEQQAHLHDSLPQLMQDAAAALLQQQQTQLTESTSSSSNGSQQQEQQQQQHVLIQQLADMLFAMAVHAVDCEASAADVGSKDSYSSDGSSSAAWYLSSGCVALVDAVASCSSTWGCNDMARGVSATVQYWTVDTVLRNIGAAWQPQVASVAVRHEGKRRGCGTKQTMQQQQQQ